MIIEKIDYIHKCFECKKIASHKIVLNKSLVKNVCLCKSCLNDFYLSIGKQLVPKAIENINKKIKVKE